MTELEELIELRLKLKSALLVLCAANIKDSWARYSAYVRLTDYSMGYEQWCYRFHHTYREGYWRQDPFDNDV